MAKLSNKRKIILDKLDSSKKYSLEEASSIVKEISTVKFDASVDLSVRLGVDPKKANEILKWNSKYDLSQMCESAWVFVKKNSK